MRFATQTIPWKDASWHDIGATNLPVHNFREEIQGHKSNLSQTRDGSQSCGLWSRKTKNRHLEVVWIDNTIWYTYATMCAQQHRTPAERSLLTKPDIYKMVYLTQTTKILVAPVHIFGFQIS